MDLKGLSYQKRELNQMYTLNMIHVITVVTTLLENLSDPISIIGWQVIRPINRLCQVQDADLILRLYD